METKKRKLNEQFVHSDSLNERWVGYLFAFIHLLQMTTPTYATAWQLCVCVCSFLQVQVEPQ
jgi:hypothetical protein